MAQSKHTPGPWKVNGPKAMNIDCRVHRVMNSERYPAAFVPAWDRPAPGEADGTDEAIANARLIAAAPELLEALENLVEEASHPYVDANGHKAFVQRLEQAKDLIAALAKDERSRT